MFRHPLRVAARFIKFLWMAVTALWDFRFRVQPEERRRGVAKDYKLRAEWCQRHSRRCARFLGITVETVGRPPNAPLWTANHMSYTDIVMISASFPTVFVSKAEVRNWPVIGALASAAGTLFVRRENRGDVKTAGDEFSAVVGAGAPVVVFLEGTSSGGDVVLPFRSSLLAPAVQNGWHVAPVAVDYALDDGTVSDDVAYWRDMTFFPHFLNLISKRNVRATISFGRARPAGTDRKALAAELREEIVTMRVARGTMRAPETQSADKAI
jgi:lyso-ornithine lipid O-acyltransferase